MAPAVLEGAMSHLEWVVGGGQTGLEVPESGRSLSGPAGFGALVEGQMTGRQATQSAAQWGTRSRIVAQ